MTPGKYQCDIQQMTQVLILLKKRWTERDGESSCGTPTRGHEDADKVNSAGTDIDNKIIDFDEIGFCKLPKVFFGYLSTLYLLTLKYFFIFKYFVLPYSIDVVSTLSYLGGTALIHDWPFCLGHQWMTLTKNQKCGAWCLICAQPEVGQIFESSIIWDARLFETPRQLCNITALDEKEDGV